ncbi:MAG: sigma-70 family RNA polymerase sigma factor [Chloroflexota bacterium]
MSSTYPTERAQQELEWMRQAQQGDLASFNALVERHQDAAYGLALRMLRDPAAAEDVTQEAFLSAYRALAQFRGGNVRSWVLTIVANGARDTLRSPARRRTTSLERHLEGTDPGGSWASADPLPERAAEQAETARIVRAAVARLPDDQRLLVGLVDLEGLDYEEAAAVAGVALGTVKSRLFRARARLRELLREAPELRGAFERPTGEAKA